MNRQMRILLSVSILLFVVPIATIACPPDCGDCRYWDGSQCQLSAECDSSGGCSGCYSCVNCYCENQCDGDQYCCGDECCSSNELCCWSPWVGYYCESPCQTVTTDTTTCSKSHDYVCPGCMVNPLLGYQCEQFNYKAYSGLQIKQCQHGCPERHWHTTSEVCYEERKCCTAGLLVGQLCFPSESGPQGLTCINCQGSPCPIQCQQAEACWNAFISCLPCGGGGDLVYTYRQDTCVCQNSN
jgi:hypothetical protein